MGAQAGAQGALKRVPARLRFKTVGLDSGDPRFAEGRTAALRSTVFFALAGGAFTAGAILTTRAFWLGRKRTRVSIQPHGDVGALGLGLEASW